MNKIERQKKLSCSIRREYPCRRGGECGDECLYCNPDNAFIMLLEMGFCSECNQKMESEDMEFCAICAAKALRRGQCNDCGSILNSAGLCRGIDLM